MIPQQIKSIDDVYTLAQGLATEHISNGSYTDIDCIDDKPFYAKAQRDFRCELINQSWLLAEKLQIDLYDLFDRIHVRTAIKLFAFKR